MPPHGSVRPRPLQAWRGQAFGIGVAALLAVQKAHDRHHRQPVLLARQFSIRLPPPCGD